MWEFPINSAEVYRWFFIKSIGDYSWRRKWQPTPVLLPGKSHGQKSLMGYSPWGQERVGRDLATKQQGDYCFLFLLFLWHLAPSMLTETGRKGTGSTVDSLQGLKRVSPSVTSGGLRQSQIQWIAGCNTLCGHEGEPHPSSWIDSENKGIYLDNGIAKQVFSFPLVLKKKKQRLLP